MRPQISKLLRALVAGLALTSLVATAEDVVVVDPVDPVAEPTTPPQKKPTFTALLAAASLQQQGVTDPTDADLGVAESNVQAMRDSGMGWGEIAKSLNLRLGDVVSAANKSPQAVKPTKVAKVTKPTKVTRVDGDPDTDTDTDPTATRTKRPSGDKKLAAAGDTTTRGLSAGRSGASNSGGGKGGGAGGGGASNGGGSGGGKGGGASNGGGGNGGGKGGGNGGGGNGGGKGGGGGNGGGKGGGGGNGGGKGGGNR